MDSKNYLLSIRVATRSSSSLMWEEGSFFIPEKTYNKTYMEDIMLDLKFLRENPDVVKQNIKNKFQDEKLKLVDEVIELDAENRKVQLEADNFRANRNSISTFSLSSFPIGTLGSIMFGITIILFFISS